MLSGYNFTNSINASREEAWFRLAWWMGNKPDLSCNRIASGLAWNKIGNISTFKPLTCAASLCRSNIPFLSTRDAVLVKYCKGVFPSLSWTVVLSGYAWIRKWTRCSEYPLIQTWCNRSIPLSFVSSAYFFFSKYPRVSLLFCSNDLFLLGRIQ